LKVLNFWVSVCNLNLVLGGDLIEVICSQ